MSAEDSAPARRRPRPPSALTVFGVGFLALLASAVCVGVGNFRANSTLLPVISFYLSGASVLITAIALLMRPSGGSRGKPPTA